MTPGEAVADALARLYAADADYWRWRDIRPDLGQLARTLAAETGQAPGRALANFLGVGIRSAQRYITEAGQRREPRLPPEAQAKLNEYGVELNKRGRAEVERHNAKERREAPARTLRKIREQGLVIDFTGDLIDPSGNTRPKPRNISVDVEPDGPYLPAFLQAAREGDEDTLGAAFRLMFFAAWKGASVDTGFGSDAWGLGDMHLTLSVA